MIALQRLRSGLQQRLSGRPKIRAAFQYAGSSIICQAVRFLGVLFSTRHIRPEEFGLYAQAFLGLVFVSVIRDIGQGNALISYQGTDRRYVLYNFKLNLLLGLLAAFLLLAVPAWVAAVPHTIRRVAPILAAIAIVENLSQAQLIVAQKSYRFFLLGCVDVAAVGSWTLTLLFAVGRVEGFVVLLLAPLVEDIVRFVALMAVVGWRYVGWAGGADLRAYYFGKFARTAIAKTFFETLAGKTDFLLLSTLSSLWQLGAYERTLQFVRIPLSLSVNLLDRVLLVSYSKEQADAAALRGIVRKGSLFIGVAVFSATALVSLGLLFLLKFALGPEWPPIILHHWWIALPFTLVTPLTWNYNLVFQGTGRSKQLLKNYCVTVFFELGLGILLVGRFGAAGMLAARGFACLVLLGYQMKTINRLFSDEPQPSIQKG